MRERGQNDTQQRVELEHGASVYENHGLPSELPGRPKMNIFYWTAALTFVNVQPSFYHQTVPLSKSSRTRSRRRTITVQ